LPQDHPISALVGETKIHGIGLADFFLHFQDRVSGCSAFINPSDKPQGQ
jgi:hypothetical protein